MLRYRLIVCHQLSVDSVIIRYQTPESKLESDWRSFFKSGQLSDFIIESADGQEFPTHKAVLACRSPSYFGKMLQSGMAESVNNRLKVEFSAEVVTALLEYFYSDSVSDLSTIAAKTIPAAHHYQLDRLMTMCKSELVKNLNCENISVALRLAKLYELDQLQSACEMFAGENKTELVKKFCLMAAEMDVENF